MIYISSACLYNKDVESTIRYLYENNIDKIELTGGSEFKKSTFDFLNEYKQNHDISFILHNYFPPPEQHFVLNLASLDENIFNKTLSFYKRAIDLSYRLGINKYGIHAGHCIDLSTCELGKNISYKVSKKKEECIEKFCFGIKELQKHNENITLYIENNVISKNNFSNLGYNPLLLVCYKDYRELLKKIDFNLLLDIGHLKVSSKTLKLNFVEELENLIHRTDYIHISDNNGFADQNLEVELNGEIHNALKKYSLHNKTITLEIYRPLNVINTSIDVVKRLM